MTCPPCKTVAYKNQVRLNYWFLDEKIAKGFFSNLGYGKLNEVCFVGLLYLLYISFSLK